MADQLLLRFKCASAPASKRMRTISSHPRSQAFIKGVVPLLVQFTLAPFRRACCTADTSLRPAALRRSRFASDECESSFFSFSFDESGSLESLDISLLPCLFLMTSCCAQVCNTVCCGPQLFSSANGRKRCCWSSCTPPPTHRVTVKAGPLFLYLLPTVYYCST